MVAADLNAFPLLTAALSSTEKIPHAEVDGYIGRAPAIDPLNPWVMALEAGALVLPAVPRPLSRRPDARWRLTPATSRPIGCTSARCPRRASRIKHSRRQCRHWQCLDATRLSLPT